jgi:hypothetical protein
VLIHEKVFVVRNLCKYIFAIYCYNFLLQYCSRVLHRAHFKLNITQHKPNPKHNSRNPRTMPKRMRIEMSVQRLEISQLQRQKRKQQNVVDNNVLAVWTWVAYTPQHPQNKVRNTNVNAEFDMPAIVKQDEKHKVHVIGREGSAGDADGKLEEERVWDKANGSNDGTEEEAEEPAKVVHALCQPATHEWMSGCMKGERGNREEQSRAGREGREGGEAGGGNGRALNWQIKK